MDSQQVIFCVFLTFLYFSEQKAGDIDYASLALIGCTKNILPHPVSFDYVHLSPTGQL